MSNRRLISIDLDGDVIPQRVLDALDEKFISVLDLDAELELKADVSTTVTSINGVLPVGGNVTLPWAAPPGGIPESDLSGAVQTKLNAVSKPAGGWVLSDLASSVQTSLSKADTALQSAALTPYAPLASPSFTGVPTAPTAPLGTSTQRLATTAFVYNVIDQGDLKGDKGDPGLVWRGSYNSGTQYATDDAVTFAGSSYRAVVPSLSKVPTDTEFWELLAAKGEPGDATSGVSWSNLTDLPTTFPPSAHVHPITDVTGLQATLDAKAAAAHAHAWPAITDKPTTFPPSAHTHPVGEISTINSPTGTTFLRGDGNWIVPTNTTYAVITEAEATAGTATTARTMSALTLKGAIQRWATGSYSTAITAIGQALNAAADAAAARTAIGAVADSDARLTNARTPTAHVHPVSEVTGLQVALDDKVGVGDSRLTDARTPTAHTHPASQISDSTAVGRSVLSALDAAAARTAIGAGTSNLALGTTSSTAKAGDYQPTWTQVTSKPTTFAPSAHNHAWAEITGTPATYPPAAHSHPISEVTNLQAALDAKVATNDSRLSDARTPTAHTHPWTEVTGKPSAFPPEAHSHDWASITGKPSTFAPSAHTHLWADITDKPSTFAPSTHAHDWASITSKPTTFAPSAHTHLWADITDKPTTFAPTIGSTGTTAVAGNDPRLTDARTPTAHTQAASTISDSTAVGRSVLTAADAAAARTAIGAGTSSLALGTTAVTAKAGDYQPTWTQVTSKPTTFAPIIGSGAADAVAGNDARLTNARTPTAHTHPISEVTNLQSSLDGKVNNVSGASGLWVGTTANLPGTGTAGVLYVTLD